MPRLSRQVRVQASYPRSYKILEHARKRDAVTKTGLMLGLGETQPVEVALDHDTGEIRGVLHRSCNSAEGKIANAAGSWGAKDMSYPAIIDYLRRLLALDEQSERPERRDRHQLIGHQVGGYQRQRSQLRLCLL